MYAFYRTITIDHTKVGASLTNFPVLVSLTNASLKTVANGGKVQNANGYDIAFYADSGQVTKLNWEVIHWDGTTGQIIAWVKIPSVSNTLDTVFYLFYDDATINTDQSTPSSTWNNTYNGVWHMPQDPTGTAPQMLDSSGNSLSLTNGGSFVSGDSVTGKIYKGLHYAGTNELSQVARSTLLETDPFSLSMWIEITSNTTTQGLPNGVGDIYAAVSHEGPNQGYAMNIVGSQYGSGIGNEPEFFSGNGSSLNLVNSGVSLALNTWTLLHGVKDSSNVYIYINGVLKAQVAATANSPTTSYNFFLSQYSQLYPSLSRLLFGNLEEVRYAKTNLSVGWALTEYNNQNSPSTFSTLGAETSTGGTSIKQQVMGRWSWPI